MFRDDKTPARVRTFRYDAQGREISNRDQPRRGVKLEYVFAYDAEGRLSTIKVGPITSKLSYDKSGRLMSEEETEPGKKRVLRYKYDAKQRRIEETGPLGRTEYRYDCKRP